MGLQFEGRHYVTQEEYDQLHKDGLLNILDVLVTDKEFARLKAEKESRDVIEALAVLALHELVSYIDVEGNPIVCDWEAYVAGKEDEFNKYWLTEEQFYIIKDYLEKTFKGKL